MEMKCNQIGLYRYFEYMATGKMIYMKYKTYAHI